MTHEEYWSLPPQERQHARILLSDDLDEQPDNEVAPLGWESGEGHLEGKGSDYEYTARD